MRSKIALLLLAGVSLLSGGCDRRSATGGQGNATAMSGEVAPTSGEVASGEVKGGAPAKDGFAARIDRSHAGQDAPDMVFTGPDGKDATLASFKGKPVLLNLWATWCGPCVAEMPMLDALAAEYKDKGLVVLTVSQDSGDAAGVSAFFAQHRLSHLMPYRDPENQLGFHFGTGLLPTSALFNRDGKEVARVAGALDWSGDNGRKLIEEAMN